MLFLVQNIHNIGFLKSKDLTLIMDNETIIVLFDIKDKKKKFM